LDELAALRETARSLLEHAAPTSRVRELGGATDTELWRRIADAGWLAMALPETAGGAGAGLAELAVVTEELGRTLAGSAFIATVLAARCLASAGDAHSKVLDQIASGAATATVCLAEAEAGWDAAAGQTSAAPDGTLTGRKILVPDAAEARFLIVSAQAPTGPELFLVDAAAVEVQATTSLDLTRRFAEVELHGVPAAALGAGSKAVTVLLHEGAALFCAETVGAASRLLEMTTVYARERKQFGRPIGSFQAVKHRCANMLIGLEASRAATDVAVRSLDASAPDATRELSAAKAFVGDACARLAADALQVHGGIGFTWELDVHLYLRRIRSNRALFGTPSWHRERLYALVAT
jgi:alkylation response protein AidB-like acyl-CoA dehydrogenase